MPVIAKGTVYLVGAGPGDPGLITRLGLEVLRTADVIVYDRLVSPELLPEARPEAKLRYVGKASSRHALGQEEINQLLVEEALAGNAVCRLKGGDPFLFGRGGEEADYLRERGVPFVVVPGVTSAIAVPAYAGIPVTDRRFASALAIATGHEGRESARKVDWQALARSADTLVVLMGVGNLPEAVGGMLSGGRSPETPAALISWGTTARQAVVRSSLGRIVEEAQRSGIGPPAVLVVGEVVALGERLDWFRPGPLRGLRVLVTRPRHQASALAERLRQAGAEPVVCSVIRTEPVEIAADVLRCVAATEWEWVIFTSANGVTSFRASLNGAQLDWRALAGAKLAAMGPGTASALESFGLRADFVPSRAIAESLAEELPAAGDGDKVLLPRAEEARDVLPDMMRQRGAQVEILTVYRTVRDDAGLSLLSTALEEGVDVVTFTSSSGVRALVETVGAEALKGIAIACIGPVTAATARGSGLSVAVEAREHTIPGLVEALIEYAEERRAKGAGEGR